ncbi:MAG: DUF3526 domain-containing protein, partial [Holophagales bacterium]|nr:DUF3526 domain-containing protein [Holophagales bacterium]
MDTRLVAVWERDPVLVAPKGHQAPFIVDTWKRETLLRFGSARYYDSRARYHQAEAELGRQTAEERFRLLEEHDRGMRRRALAIEVFRLLSPGEMVARASAHIAGTSIEQHRAFLEAARRYRRDLLAVLEERDAFGSWAWFTDDPPGARPWTAFLGLSPEQIAPEDLPGIADRFRAPEIQERMAAELARRDHGGSRLDLSSLPTFEFRSPPPTLRALAGVAAPLLTALGLLLVWVAYTVRRRARLAGEGRLGSALGPTVEAPWGGPAPSVGAHGVEARSRGVRLPRARSLGVPRFLGPGWLPGRDRGGFLAGFWNELGEIVSHPRWWTVSAVVAVLMSLACGYHGIELAKPGEGRA